MLMQRRKMNKRGDIQSIIISIIMVVVMAIVAVVFAMAFDEVMDELQSQEQFSNRSLETMKMVQGRTIPLLDFMIFFTLVGLMIGLIISSMYIDSLPAMAPIFMLFLVVAVFIAAQFTNIYDRVATDDKVIATSEQFTLTNAILGANFPIIILIVGVIVILILYVKSKSPGGLP